MVASGMSYIPSALKIFHPNSRRAFFVENDSEQRTEIQCFVGFPTDAANGASHTTAVRWAADYDLSPGSYGSTDIQNVPVPSVTVVGLSYRGRGGRAWKIIDRGFLFDLREGALLELLTKGEGSFKTGTLQGPFIWISDGGLRLVRVDSEQHRNAMLGRAPRSTVSEPEQGNIFEVKKNKYITKISAQKQKREVWLYTDSSPTSLDGVFLANALLDGRLRRPTKRPVLPANSLVGTLKPDQTGFLEFLFRKVIAETVEWTTESYELFMEAIASARPASNSSVYPFDLFIERIAGMQYCLTTKETLHEITLYHKYMDNIRTSGYYQTGSRSTGTRIEPFRVYTSNMEVVKNVLDAGFIEVTSNPNPSCPSCEEIWKYNQRYASNNPQNTRYLAVINPQFPQHLADCNTQSVEAHMSNAEMLRPGLIAKFGLTREHFEPIRPPLPTSNVLTNNPSLVSILNNRVQTSSGKLIPSFSNFQY